MNKKQINLATSVLLAICFVLSFNTYSEAACTAVDSLPSTLTSGSWCLSGSMTMTATGNAITIGGDDVVFDLAGYTINNTGAYTNRGIYSSGGRKNITIRNGTISGFYDNIALFNDSGNNKNILIENITSTDTLSGANVYADTAIIKNSHFFGGDACAAIYVFGKNISVINNDISNTYESCGNHIYAQGLSGQNSSLLIEGNRVSAYAPYASAGQSGIEVNAGRAVVVNNRISNMETGVIFQDGTYGNFRDNITSNCTTSYTIPTTGVSNLGNNY